MSNNNTRNFSNQVSYNLNPDKDIKTFMGITTLPSDIDYTYGVNLKFTYGASYSFANMSDPTNSVSITWILYKSDGITPICQTTFSLDSGNIPTPIVPINMSEIFNNIVFNVQDNNTLIYAVIVSGNNSIVGNISINIEFDYLFNDTYLSPVYSYTASYKQVDFLQEGTTKLGESVIPNTYCFFLNSSYITRIGLTYTIFYYGLDGNNTLLFSLIDSNNIELGNYEYSAIYTGSPVGISVVETVFFDNISISPDTKIIINVTATNIQVQNVFTNIKYNYHPRPIIYGFDKIGNYYYLNRATDGEKNTWQLAGQADCVSTGCDCTTVVCFNNQVTLIDKNNRSTLIPSPTTDTSPKFISISCADINNIYGILDNDKNVYTYVDNEWATILGMKSSLISVSVGYDGSLFVIDQTNRVIKYVNGKWQQILINGNLLKANEIAVLNSATVWGIYNNNVFLYIDGKLLTTYLPVVGNIKIISADISVSYDGSVWCIVNGILFQREGINTYDLIGTAWNLISITELTIDETELFPFLQITSNIPVPTIVNPVYQINYMPISSMLDTFLLPRVSYLTSPAISFSTNMIWGNSSSGSAYYFDNNLGIWSLGGSSEFISVGCNNTAAFFSNNVLHIGSVHTDLETSSYFTDVKWYEYYPGVENVNFIYFTMADENYITAVGDDNNIYRYSSSDKWYTLGSPPTGCIFSTVSVGYEASTFATDINGNVYLLELDDTFNNTWNIQYSINPNSLESTNLKFIELSVGSKDYYWGINNVNNNNIIQLSYNNHIITVDPPFDHSNNYIKSQDPPVPDNVQLPRDDGVLNEIVQWWYWTGHLQSKDNTLILGFEITFFIVLGEGNLLQCAITDVTNNQFYFNEYLSSGQPDIIPNAFNLVAENGIGLATGGNGIDHLECTAGPYKLVIDAVQTKPTTIHYGGQRHYFSFGGNTKYYSRTQMQTVGTIQNTTTNVTKEVDGNTWFDRQYGGLLIAISKGWQWMAIGLNDNTDIMLFDFKGNYTNENFGSFTNANGGTRFDFNSFSLLDIGAGWTSPNTNVVYPNIWQVQFPIDSSGTLGPKYIIMPAVADQELRVKYSPIYWEGKCYVYPSTSNDFLESIAAIESGSVTRVGESYTELNGYASNPNPQIPWWTTPTSSVLTDKISVCVDGTVYGLFNGIMYRRDGITSTLPQGNVWTLMSNPISNNSISTSSQLNSFSVGPGPTNTNTGVNPTYTFPLSSNSVQEPISPNDTSVWSIGYDNNPYFLFTDMSTNFPTLLPNYNLTDFALSQFTYDSLGGSNYNVRNRNNTTGSNPLLIDVFIVPQNYTQNFATTLNVSFSCASNAPGINITYGFYTNNGGALTPITPPIHFITTTSVSPTVLTPVANITFVPGMSIFYGITIGDGSDSTTTLSSLNMSANFDYNYTILPLNYFDFNCTSGSPITPGQPVTIGFPRSLPEDFNYSIPVPIGTVNFVVTNISSNVPAGPVSATISLINATTGISFYNQTISLTNNTTLTFQNTVSTIQFPPIDQKINIQVSVLSSGAQFYNITVNLNFGYTPLEIPPPNCIAIGYNNNVLYCDNTNSSLTQIYIRQDYSVGVPSGNSWGKFSKLTGSTINPPLAQGTNTIKFYQMQVGDINNNLWALDFSGNIYKYQNNSPAGSLTYSGVWNRVSTGIPTNPTFQNISLGLDGTMYAITGIPIKENTFVPVPNQFILNGTAGGVIVLGTFTVPLDYVPNSYAVVIATYQGIYGPNQPSQLQEYSWYVRDSNNLNIIRWGLIVPAGQTRQQPSPYGPDQIFQNVQLGTPGSTITVYAEAHYPASSLQNPGIIIRSITYSKTTIPPNNVYFSVSPYTSWTELVTPKLVWISAGTPNYYWGIDGNNNIYAYSNGIPRYIPFPQQITSVGNVDISVSYDGTVWCIVNGIIFRRDGITSTNKYGEIWTQIPGNTRILDEGNIYTLSANCGPSTWNVPIFPQPNTVSYPFYHDDVVLWTLLNGIIYLYSNFNWQIILPNTTTSTSVNLIQLSVGFDGSVFGLDAANLLYYRSGITLSNLGGTSWTQFTPNFSSTQSSYTPAPPPTSKMSYIFIYNLLNIYLVFEDGSLYYSNDFTISNTTRYFAQFYIDYLGNNLLVQSLSLTGSYFLNIITQDQNCYMVSPSSAELASSSNNFSSIVNVDLGNTLNWSLNQINNINYIYYNYDTLINNPPGSNNILDITISVAGIVCVIDDKGIIYRFFGNPVGQYSWNLVFTPVNVSTSQVPNINIMFPIVVPETNTSVSENLNTPFYNIYKYNGIINGGGSNNNRIIGTFTVPQDYDGVSYATILGSYQGIYGPENPESVQQYDFGFYNTTTNITLFKWTLLVYENETVVQPTLENNFTTINAILGPPGSIINVYASVSYFGATMTNPQVYIQSISYPNQLNVSYTSTGWQSYYISVDKNTTWQNLNNGNVIVSPPYKEIFSTTLPYGFTTSKYYQGTENYYTGFYQPVVLPVNPNYTPESNYYATNKNSSFNFAYGHSGGGSRASLSNLGVIKSLFNAGFYNFNYFAYTCTNSGGGYTNFKLNYKRVDPFQGTQQSKVEIYSMLGPYYQSNQLTYDILKESQPNPQKIRNPMSLLVTNYFEWELTNHLTPFNLASGNEINNDSWNIVSLNIDSLNKKIYDNDGVTSNLYNRNLQLITPITKVTNTICYISRCDKDQNGIDNMSIPIAVWGLFRRENVGAWYWRTTTITLYPSEFTPSSSGTYRTAGINSTAGDNFYYSFKTDTAITGSTQSMTANGNTNITGTGGSILNAKFKSVVRGWASRPTFTTFIPNCQVLDGLYISSAAIGVDYTIGGCYYPQLIDPSRTGSVNSDPLSDKTLYADGGRIDNYGLIPLLQRRMNNIIIVGATARGLIPPGPFQSRNEDIGLYFNVDDTKNSQYYTNKTVSGVFDKSDLNPMWNLLWSNYYYYGVAICTFNHNFNPSSQCIGAYGFGDYYYGDYANRGAPLNIPIPAGTQVSRYIPTITWFFLQRPVAYQTVPKNARDDIDPAFYIRNQPASCRLVNSSFWKSILGRSGFGNNKPWGVYSTLTNPSRTIDDGQGGVQTVDDYNFPYYNTFTKLMLLSFESMNALSYYQSSLTDYYLIPFIKKNMAPFHMFLGANYVIPIINLRESNYTDSVSIIDLPYAVPTALTPQPAIFNNTNINITYCPQILGYIMIQSNKLRIYYNTVCSSAPNQAANWKMSQSIYTLIDGNNNPILYSGTTNIFVDNFGNIIISGSDTTNDRINNSLLYFFNYSVLLDSIVTAIPVAPYNTQQPPPNVNITCTKINYPGCNFIGNTSLLLTSLHQSKLTAPAKTRYYIGNGQANVFGGSSNVFYIDNNIASGVNPTPILFGGFTLPNTYVFAIVDTCKMYSQNDPTQYHQYVVCVNTPGQANGPLNYSSQLTFCTEPFGPNPMQNTVYYPAPSLYQFGVYAIEYCPVMNSLLVAYSTNPTGLLGIDVYDCTYDFNDSLPFNPPARSDPIKYTSTMYQVGSGGAGDFPGDFIPNRIPVFQLNLTPQKICNIKYIGKQLFLFVDAAVYYLTDYAGFYPPGSSSLSLEFTISVNVPGGNLLNIY
jgi:predicted secreted hydrolase